MNESPKRQWHQLSLSDAFALVTGAGLSVAAFLKIRGSYQATVGAHLAKDTVTALFVFLVGSGIVAALGGRKSQALVLMAIALQILSAIALAIPTFGFDHQSEWGLDFDHLMLLCFVYAAALIGGLAIAHVYDHARAIPLQLWLMPILGAMIFLVKVIRANI